MEYVSICLFIYTKMKGNSTRQILLINLSLVECINSLISLLCLFAVYLYYFNQTKLSGEIYSYINYIKTTGRFYLYCFTMIFVIVDRLICTLLNIRLPIIWDKKKALRLLIVTWIFSILTCAAVGVAYKVNGIKP